jgi:HSP20 family protein
MYYRGYGCGGPGSWSHGFGGQAPVNVSESDSTYTITLFAPALDKEKIVLTTRNDLLTIRYAGNRDRDDQHFTRREYRTENIDRSFDLKGKVDTENISASYAEGVLTINLPKTAAARKPAQDIPIG